MDLPCLTRATVGEGAKIQRKESQKKSRYLPDSTSISRGLIHYLSDYVSNACSLFRPLLIQRDGLTAPPFFSQGTPLLSQGLGFHGLPPYCFRKFDTRGGGMWHVLIFAP